MSSCNAIMIGGVAFLCGALVSVSVDAQANGGEDQDNQTTWQYRCDVSNGNRPDQVQYKANGFGAQGWEMVGYTGMGQGTMVSYCFKRMMKPVPRQVGETESELKLDW